MERFMLTTACKPWLCIPKINSQQSIVNSQQSTVNIVNVIQITLYWQKVNNLLKLKSPQINLRYLIMKNARKNFIREI
ncbi:hypothetical protein LYNGBM3L_44000 [Moorena producens 3L]|uniref:Uncharacterized protein n=1 Tax=Moorena producens 3L TaxID=489825 RepID=F4XQC7_9CYAN|nr:hypothetical protein LYNGBM3L_44000 [Moorena producens 3L]OLT67047.1 hypothetical protein BI334_20330 [Moorena producens 3L]